MDFKRLVSIQDLSCFGKCSLSVALPVISSAGIETVVLPTAILSTHTGEFEGYSFHSLSSQFKEISSHWKKLNIMFDAIYVGYIGSVELIDFVSEFIDEFKNENTIVFIDPAMADNGKFYSGLDKNYALALKSLCKKADFISPNLTEALILTDFGCEFKDFDEKDSQKLLKELSRISPNPIVTGIFGEDTVSTASYEKETGKFSINSYPLKEGIFYGSGDLFSSSFMGYLLKGNSFTESVKKASFFVNDCIENSMHEREKYWYGLNFEKSLHLLHE